MDEQVLLLRTQLRQVIGVVEPLKRGKNELSVCMGEGYVGREGGKEGDVSV
jgi:hypothetical protein